MTTRELLQMAFTALERGIEFVPVGYGIERQQWEAIEAIHSHLAQSEPACLTDIVGYGQFVDGKLVACSQTEINVAIGGKSIECRPLYSVKEQL